MYRLLGEERSIPPLGYLAVSPQVPEHADAGRGRMAHRGRGRRRAGTRRRPEGRGRRVRLEGRRRAPRAVDVDPRRARRGDRRDPRAHRPGEPVDARRAVRARSTTPRSPSRVPSGSCTTDAWGPFVVAPEVLTGPRSVETVNLVAAPQLADGPPGAVDALRGRLVDAQATLAGSKDVEAVGKRFSSRLATTIDVAKHNLAATRVSLVIVGLMLVVLAVTVLMLAARLLADRRAPEQTLMSSRGASGLAAVRPRDARGGRRRTAHDGCSRRGCAGLLFGAMTSVGPLASAGLDTDPGRPASLWIACAVVVVRARRRAARPAPASPRQRRRRRAAAGAAGPPGWSGALRRGPRRSSCSPASPSGS